MARVSLWHTTPHAPHQRLRRNEKHKYQQQRREQVCSQKTATHPSLENRCSATSCSPLPGESTTENSDMPKTKVAWLLLGSAQHLLDVSQRVALREVIGMALPEHVSHSTAGNNLQAATTHPHSERELWKRSQESYSCNSPDKGNFLALLL